MKQILFATLFVFTVLSGCKDDAPVDDNNNNTSGDARENILGKYTCNYKLFNAVTGAESDKGSFDCEIWANTEDDNKFDFRIDGLTLLMSGTGLTKISTGYTFSIPEQTVKNFGDLVGKPIINIDGQTTRVDGEVKSSNGNIVCYCERARKQGQDDDLFEFSFVRK